MHKATVATVGILFLSVAALPMPVAGAGADRPDESSDSQHAAIAGGAAVTVAGAAPAHPRRGRVLALPGVESIGVPLLVAIGGLLGLLLGAAAVSLRRTRSASGDRPTADSSAAPIDGTDVPATAQPRIEPDREEGSPAIRTDEEYVVQLLIANHGRMRQARIVEETDWSKAKVSRLLSRMEERDQVVRERAGREKIVQLADANTSIPL